MSQKKVEVVRKTYRVLAKGVDERAVTSLVEAGLAERAARDNDRGAPQGET